MSSNLPAAAFARRFPNLSGGSAGSHGRIWAMLETLSDEELGKVGIIAIAVNADRKIRAHEAGRCDALCELCPLPPRAA